MSLSRGSLRLGAVGVCEPGRLLCLALGLESWSIAVILVNTAIANGCAGPSAATKATASAPTAVCCGQRSDHQSSRRHHRDRHRNGERKRRDGGPSELDTERAEVGRDAADAVTDCAPAPSRLPNTEVILPTSWPKSPTAAAASLTSAVTLTLS